MKTVTRSPAPCEPPNCPICATGKLRWHPLTKRWSIHCWSKECVSKNKKRQSKELRARKKESGLVMTQVEGKKFWVTQDKLSELNKERRLARKGREKKKNFVCLIPGCAGKALARDMCHAHYQKWRKKSPNWNRVLKPRRTDISEYSLHCRPRKRVYEAFYTAANNEGVSKHAFLNMIVELWERQYRNNGYSSPLSPSYMLDPNIFALSQKYKRT